MNASTQSNTTKLTREQITHLAYQIWEAEGRPEGRALEHWQRAERQGAKAPAEVMPPGNPAADTERTKGPQVRARRR